MYSFSVPPSRCLYHSTLPLPHCWIRGASDNCRATGPGGAAAHRQAAAARAKRSRDPAACGVGGTWGQAPSPRWMDTLPLDRYSEVRAGPPSTCAPGGSRGPQICPCILSQGSPRLNTLENVVLGHSKEIRELQQKTGWKYRKSPPPFWVGDFFTDGRSLSYGHLF